MMLLPDINHTSLYDQILHMIKNPYICTV